MDIDKAVSGHCPHRDSTLNACDNIHVGFMPKQPVRLKALLRFCSHFLLPVMMISLKN